MQREDTAVQRRAADLKAAGMNRLMAVGDGAEAGTLTSFQGNAGGSAPQVDINPIESFLAAKQSQANIANTEAQTALIKNKSETEKAKNALTIEQKALTELMQAKTRQETSKILAETLREYNDYALESEGGFKSNDTTRANNLYTTIDLLVRLAAQKFGLNIWSKPKGKGKPFPGTDGKGNITDPVKAAEEIQRLYGGVY